MERDGTERNENGTLRNRALTEQGTKRNKKRNSVFLYHCSVFCTSVPFFPQNSMFLYHCSVFAPLFRFFPQWNKKTEQCVFVPLFRFCTTVPFFPQWNKKRNSVFLYHCSVFCTTVPFLPQRNKKNGTVCFCITVPFFSLLFRFSTTEQNGTVCFCTTVPDKRIQQLSGRTPAQQSKSREENVPDQVIYLQFRRKKQRLTLTKL